MIRQLSHSEVIGIRDVYGFEYFGRSHKKLVDRYKEYPHKMSDPSLVKYENAFIHTVINNRAQKKEKGEVTDDSTA